MKPVYPVASQNGSPDDLVDDETLMRAVAAGDRSAFAELLERHIHKLHHYILRTTNASADADDLAQEAFLRVWSNASGFEASSASFSTWLTRIARNLCIDRHRRIQARPAGHLVNDSEDALNALAEDERTAANELQHQRDLQRLRRAISQLPERQRTAITLFQLQGRSYAEVAAILEVNLSAVESLLARARRALRATLTSEENQAAEDPAKHDVRKNRRNGAP